MRMVTARACAVSLPATGRLERQWARLSRRPVGWRVGVAAAAEGLQNDSLPAAAGPTSSLWTGLLHAEAQRRADQELRVPPRRLPVDSRVAGSRGAVLPICCASSASL